MGTPLVSVVIPAFNQERWIDAAIESVLAQRHPAFEVVVVDDGSTDGTRARLERFGPQVRVLGQGNRGASAARNAGVRAARGELIAFCDADDVQHPERLAVTTAVLEQMPDVAFVASDFSELSGQIVTSPRALHTRWLGPTSRPFARELRAAFGEGCSVAELGLPDRSSSGAGSRVSRPGAGVVRPRALRVGRGAAHPSLGVRRRRCVRRTPRDLRRLGVDVADREDADRRVPRPAAVPLPKTTRTRRRVAAPTSVARTSRSLSRCGSPMP
jgi:hypothetical protein